MALDFDVPGSLRSDYKVPFYVLRSLNLKTLGRALDVGALMHLSTIMYAKDGKHRSMLSLPRETGCRKLQGTLCPRFSKEGQRHQRPALDPGPRLTFYTGTDDCRLCTLTRTGYPPKTPLDRGSQPRTRLGRNTLRSQGTLPVHMSRSLPTAMTVRAAMV